jgi:hypothetical protein
MGIKNIIEIEVVGCEKANSFNVDTRKIEEKKTPDGRSVFSLFYIEKGKKKVGNIEVDEQTVEKVGSLIELKPGKYLCEVELFAFEKKIYHRVTALFPNK